MSGKTFFVILALLSITFAGCSVKEAVITEEQSYSSLLARVKNFDRSVDFTALRLAYTKTPDYNPYAKYGGERQVMHDALKNKRYETALINAQFILHRNYVDIDAHFVCKIAYREMNNTEKSDFHHFVVKGLIDSIFNSGDGKSQETAYLVINIDEENVVLSVLGFRKTMQSLKSSNGHLYDEIEAINRETGESSLFYFEVDLLLGWLNRRFQK